MSSYGGSADEHLDADGLVVDLDALKRIGGLDSLLGLVEDDGGASQALAIGAILEQDPTGLANVDHCIEIFLQGALVVVAIK